MTCMSSTDLHPDTSPLALSPGEWLAIRAWRHPGAVCRDCAQDGGEAVLARAAEAFRAFLADAQQGGTRRAPRLARPDSPSLTKDERRLLHAVTAAQAGDEERMDNYLYSIALDPASRSRLAEAIRALAAALAAAGHRLPGPPEAQQPIPAPALPVARAHGLALRGIAVAWPSGLR